MPTAKRAANQSVKETVKKGAGRKREKPGASGAGDYYHLEVRPSEGFSTFRTHDVGEKGGLQRVAGQRADGSWETQKWLISKEMAHVEGGWLVADTQEARDVLRDLGSAPEHIEGDRFRAQPEAAPAR